MSRWLSSLGCLVLIGVLHAADPAPETLPVKPRQLDDLPIPPGTIIVLRDSKETLGSIQGVVLSAEEYRKLQETIERLRKEAAPGRPRIPSVCRITGKVESRGTQEIVSLGVTIEFHSGEGRTTWFLGFRRALLVRARLDGDDVPELVDSPDGLTLVTEKAGRHVLVMDLELPLPSRSSRTGERGLAIYLPGSPITLIDRFELPTGVPSLRLRPVSSAAPNTPPPTTIDAKDLLRQAGRSPAVALGAVDGVELTWDHPMATGPSEPLLAADGEITVQANETFIETVAVLQCRALRGRPKEWRLQTPPASEVSVSGAGDSPPTVTPTAADRSQWLIQTRQGEVESLKVEVRVRTAESPGRPVPIGPFHLVGALRQQGTLRLIGPNFLRLRTSRPRSDLGPKELTTDPAAPTRGVVDFVQASFAYGVTATNTPQAPYLFLDREPIRGEVRAQVTHQLDLTEAGWRLTTDIRAVPIRTELEVLEVEVPPVLHPTIEASPRELVEKIERADSTSNRWRIRFAYSRRTETTIRLEGLYPRTSTSAPVARESANLVLPRLQQVIERESRVTVVVPEGLDLSGTVREWDRDRAIGTIPLVMQPGQPPMMSAQTPRAAGVVELTWGPLGGSTPTVLTLDVQLEPQRAVVRQQIPMVGPNPKQIVLRRVGSTAIEPRLLTPGTLTPRSNGEWIVTWPADANREGQVHLTWTQPTTIKDDRIELSFLVPVTMASIETQARIWTTADFGYRPLAATDAWEALPPEPIGDRLIWPGLQLAASSTANPLILRLVKTAPLVPGLVVERALIQCVLGENHRWNCRAWLAVRNVSAPSLDFALPEDWASGSPVSVILNGQALDPSAIAPVEDSNSSFWRIPLPKAERVDVQILYVIEPREATRGILAPWARQFAPLRFPETVFVEAVYWDFEGLSDSFVLPLRSTVHLENRWGWRRLMPTPVAARSRQELESWVRAGFGNGVESQAAGAVGRGQLVVRQNRLESVELLLVPRMTWYFLSSLAILGVAIILGLGRRLGSGFWILSAALAIAALTAALRWPVAASIFLAGSLPGVVAIVLVIVLQWWQRRQYQRRMIFLPAFERGRSSATPTRPGSSHRPREASPPVGSAATT